jgi:phosphohistidine phosphatase
MNLFILRHASAGTRRANPLIDVKRPLDKEGKHHCLQLAHVLNALNTQFDLVISSPLKRSLQTAALVGTDLQAVPGSAP